jgi:carboxypeptidase Taq
MLPHLERNLELRRRYVACFDHDGDPYYVVLDDYEPGMKTVEVEPIFDRLMAALLPWLRSIADAEPIYDSCLRGRFPREKQRLFSLTVLERWGMDRTAWRLDRTVHPFATSFVPTHIRLTTNFHEDSLHGILSRLHEFGHGIYERSIAPHYTRTPPAQGVSSSFHESQSRLWENLVGRSISTWRFFHPLRQEQFPDRFGDGQSRLRDGRRARQRGRKARDHLHLAGGAAARDAEGHACIAARKVHSRRRRALAHLERQPHRIRAHSQHRARVARRGR